MVAPPNKYMKDYIIITESTCDLPKEYIDEKKHQLEVVPLTFSFGDKTFLDGEMEYKDFYARLREGKIPKTSQLSPENAKSIFLKYVEKGINIIYISFSSGLSGTCSNAFMAANEILENNKDIKITVIDSLAASTGQGLLVMKALEKKEEGMGYDELVDYIKKTVNHICHGFTVDDLFFLHKGGRVSKGTAILGTAINIKPILHVDNEGHLINIDKVRGRKRAITKLADFVEERIAGYEDKNKTVAICHGDCLEDAKYLESLLRERFNFQNIVITYTGTVIGSHSGPGTLAVFFEGKEK